MAQILFTFVFGFLFIVSSVNVEPIVLQIIDMVAGIYFISMGAFLGWLRARE